METWEYFINPSRGKNTIDREEFKLKTDTTKELTMQFIIDTNGLKTSDLDVGTFYESTDNPGVLYLYIGVEKNTKFPCSIVVKTGALSTINWPVGRVFTKVEIEAETGGWNVKTCTEQIVVGDSFAYSDLASYLRTQEFSFNGASIGAVVIQGPSGAGGTISYQTMAKATHYLVNKSVTLHVQ